MESSVGDFYMLDDDGEASWLKLDASSAISSWTHRRSVREQNKSLRRVYEEAEMVYGRDVHDHEGFFFILLGNIFSQ
jgi:hypothetical protein